MSASFWQRNRKPSPSHFEANQMPTGCHGLVNFFREVVRLSPILYRSKNLYLSVDVTPGKPECTSNHVDKIEHPVMLPPSPFLPPLPLWICLASLHPSFLVGWDPTLPPSKLLNLKIIHETWRPSSPEGTTLIAWYSPVIITCRLHNQHYLSGRSSC